MPDSLARRIASTVRDVPDFPRPGILFRDITPVLADGELFSHIITHFATTHANRGCDVVAGIEARGFILGGAVAAALNIGFVPIRKPGKLPRERYTVEYALEYGTDALEAHVDSITQGARVLLVDDVLATGGTAVAAMQLVRGLGGVIAGAAFLIELGFLDGRSRLDAPTDVILTY